MHFFAEFANFSKNSCKTHAIDTMQTSGIDFSVSVCPLFSPSSNRKTLRGSTIETPPWVVNAHAHQIRFAQHWLRHYCSACMLSAPYKASKTGIVKRLNEILHNDNKGVRPVSDERQRQALMRKLQDPVWQKEMERRYREIGPVAGTEYEALPPVPIVRDSSPSISRFESLPITGIWHEPTTIEELWDGNWSRNSGGYSLSRFPDGTVKFVLPDGSRSIYKPCRAKKLYSWLIERHDSGGRHTATSKVTDRYPNAEKALFEMHRAVLDEFDNLSALD